MPARSDTHVEYLAGCLLNTAIPRLVMRSVPPAMLAALLNGMQLYIDYLVAAYTLPTTAVAAVSASQPLQYLIFSMEALIAVGAANIVSARLGRGESNSRLALAATLNQLAVGAGLLLALSGPILVPLYQDLVALEGTVATEAWRYIMVLLVGSMLLFAATARLSLLQGLGRMGSMFTAMAAGALANLLISLCAVWLLRLEIVGVALGTLAGYLVCAIVAEWALRRRGMRMPFVFKGADRALRRQILSVGHSGMVIHLLFFVQTAAMFRAVGLQGEESDTAVLGAAFRVVMLAVYLVTGVSRAMQPALAASHAAGLQQRATQVLGGYYAAAFLVTGVLALPALYHAQWLLSLMLPTHPAGPADIAYFRSYVMILPALPVLLLGMVRLQATGRAPAASFLALLRLFGLFMPLLYFTSSALGVGGIYLSLLATEWLLVPLVIVVARRPAISVGTFPPVQIDGTPKVRSS